MLLQEQQLVLEDGGDSESDSDNAVKTGRIPTLSGLKNKKWKLILIVALIIVVIIIVVVILIKTSKVNNGKYKDGDKSNVPYVISSMVMDKLVIVYDASNNYTYAFQNEDGNYVGLDDAIDDAIKTLNQNESSGLSYLGEFENQDTQRALLKKMIQAEMATQYPDLTANENLGLSVSTTGGSSATAVQYTGSSNDYCVDMTSSNALPACSEAQLKQIVENSEMSEKAKANMMSALPNLVEYQSKYKVNAVFFMAVVKSESTWGTGWDLIDPSTYNWCSIKGTKNGGYKDRNGTSWNKYNSFGEAAEDFFALIARDGGYYFGAGKYTVQTIAPTYCNVDWGKSVAGAIEKYYTSIGITPNTSGTATALGGDGTTELSGDTTSSSAQNVTSTTGDIKIDDKVDKESTAQGGIKVKRKDENGNDVDLKYTSTENFNALVAMNDPRALEYYTLVKTSGSGSGNSSSSSNGVALQGSEVSEQIWNFLVNDMGYTEQVAAAILGNAMQEAGGNTLNIDPSIKNSQGYYGVFQWSPKTDVVGKDLAGQLEYFKTTWLKEFDTYAKNYKAGFSYEEFKKMTDIDQATIAFATIMERYEGYANGVWQSYAVTGSTEKYDQRITNANNAYATYGGKSSGNSTNTSGSSSTSTNNTSTATSSSTTISGGSFADVAAKCHQYLSDNHYYYCNSGRDLPVKAGDCGYIDCTSYVSMALEQFGITNWPNYPHQLTSGNIASYGLSNLEVVYQNPGSGITNIEEFKKSGAQAGDIVVMKGHAQIFYGYDTNGTAVWLNCGENEPIAKDVGTDKYNSIFSPILYIFRVPGSGTSIKSLDNFLFIGDSRYKGIESQLSALGSNITAKGVTSSTPKQWTPVVKSGHGTINAGSYAEEVTLPDSVSGVSVMLGVNGVTNTTQVDDMKELLNALHDRYPEAPIMVNSVYHLGIAYGNGTDSMNQAVDNFNQAMKDFCGQNSWAHYVDVTQNLDDSSGKLKSEFSSDGLHISSSEGITTLVDNIKNAIMSSGIMASDSENTDGKSNRPGYSIVVANRKDIYTTVTDTYEYSRSYTIEKSNGHTASASKTTDTPGSQVVKSSAETQYSSQNADYQAALQNFTLYFDFLWAILVNSNNTSLVSEWAGLVCDNVGENGKVIVTVYSDVNTSTSSTTQSKGTITKTSGSDGSVVSCDVYNVNETTDVQTVTLQSKPCITLADTWLEKYENEAEDYNTYQSKSEETITEKIDSTSSDDNIIKILKKYDNTLDSLTNEEYIVDEMLEENEKVAFMIDIYNYILQIANGKNKENLKFQLTSVLDTNLFDLTNADSTSTTKALLYDSLTISDSEREQLYKAVEQICSSFGNDDKNTERKKYVTSVILNRALSSEFPSSVGDIIKQAGQFENFDSSSLSSVTASEETKSAVDAVIVGGDCAQHSVYFAKPSTAEKNKWESNYKFTFNDGDKTDNSFNYYTTESIDSELSKYETTISGTMTKNSVTADTIINWANSQVGKSDFTDSKQNATLSSSNSSQQFIKSAYAAGGFEYISGDIPCPNEIKKRSDGTVDWSEIPNGAVLVANNGISSLYVGNGYVVEAGGSTIQKVTIDQSQGAGQFKGWGFAATDQKAAQEKMVVTISGSGGNYAEGWTSYGAKNAQIRSTGIAGVYKVGNRAHNVYVQGYNDVWGGKSYSQGTYGTSACGATSVAIVVSGYKANVRPDEVGAYIYQSLGLSNGSRTTAVTGHQALTNALNHYGLKAEWKSTISKEQVIQHLKQGNPVIINVHGSGTGIGNNKYTGHYVTLLGINAQGEIFLGDAAGGGNNNGYFSEDKIFGNLGGGSSVCLISQ